MDANARAPIAALFEVVFDAKVGHTISWKRSHPGIDLDGVEYRCLPSGLHAIPSDLVYFVHGAHVGVSAFVQGKADEAHRHAHFVAVGALVPLTYGRMGRSWMHAEDLRMLAQQRLTESHDPRALEVYWKTHMADESVDRPTSTSPTSMRRPSLPGAMDGATRKRPRATSDVSGGLSSSAATLSPNHPAASMIDLLDTFGPLVFPVYRAALLRRRILLLTTPPVQESAAFVYLLSVLSGVPPALEESLASEQDPVLRIQPLFTIGIHDIPRLSEDKSERGWIACTTDDILEEKKDIYDVFIKLPPHYPSAHVQQWPRVRTVDGRDVKATQRDLRRYRLLRSALDRMASRRARYHDDPDDTSNDADDGLRSLARASTSALVNEVKHIPPGEHSVCEPVSWSAMAYNGFMWWASAGEMEAWENEEARADRQLFEQVPESEDLMRHIAPDSGEGVQDEQRRTQLEIADATVLTAYFHQLTAEILQPLIDRVEEADDETEEGIASVPIRLTDDDIRVMGLDTWSKADREFASEALELYLKRDALMDEGGVDICGIRIC